MALLFQVSPKIPIYRKSEITGHINYYVKHRAVLYSLAVRSKEADSKVDSWQL